ncbi:uncharacterized protein LOC114303210 [Camellia sinensis]|uniref:uncharacterized protein LOC114303210 n=1 Tax=Camellia sinensis TaxID=4442 RepID=UPI0010355A8B|nr:uncharacterized protein LOC114303210 [Camellia sinensis]
MSGVTHTEEHRGGEIAAGLGKWAMRVKDMKPRDNCFLCDELHWARDCPKRRSLIAKLEEQEREEQSCMGYLQLLEAKPTASTQGDKGLMYVEGKVDREATQVMVDTGASHHFINAEEAKRVDPNLDGGQGLMKVENTKVKSVEGLAQGVELHLGEWREEVNDHGVVLEIELPREFNMAMLPRDNTWCIMDGGPHMVPTVNKGKPRRRKSRREPATSKKETRRGRREHRWGRMSRPANVTRPNCPREGNLKKKRLLEWLGSSWKT